MSTWITSDVHIGHKNIVKGISEWEDKSPCRNFETLEEHDSTIIDNINKLVHKDDILYILGDIFFGGRDVIISYRNRIICNNIHLVLGNHDLLIRKNAQLSEHVYARDLFKSCSDVLEKKIGNSKFFMSHYAHRTWPNSSRGSYHLYGHSHGSLEWQQWGRSMDVGIDTHPEFRPYHIDEIRSILDKREIYAPDHHKRKDNEHS